jgi:Zn-dependent protease
MMSAHFMFGKDSIRLFRIRGIDVFLHWSWFVVAAFEISSRQNAYGSPLWNVVEYLALFLIVLLHEFGHALACRQVGGEAHRIMLWPLGGVASVSPPQRPEAMLWSIAAGPLVNVILVGILWGAGSAAGVFNLPEAFPSAGELLHNLSIMNAALLVFNLLPIYPLDGGQILRSLLWFVIGRANSLMAAAVFGFLGVAGVLLLAIKLGSGWFAVLGIYIALNCWNGFRAARALMRMENALRHDEYRCPLCRAHPHLGNFWKCHICSKVFDTFDNLAVCPGCGIQFESTLCLDCRTASPFSAWKDASPMTQPTNTELELPVVKPLAEPLYNVKNWMRIAGVLTISAGVLIGLTIIGVVVAWIPILAGVALFQCASKVEEAVITGKSEYLTSALSKLGSYFKFTAVMRLMLFAFLFLLIVVVIAIVGLSRSLQPKNEANAIANIEKINAAQAKYLASRQKYGSLEELVSAGLLDPRMLDQNMGYRLQIETQKDSYIILASALTPGGRYDYYSFSDAVVRYSSDSRKAPRGLSAAPVK